MRIWIRGALVAATTLASVVMTAPAVHAGTGNEVALPDLPSELLTCIAEQLSVTDQVNFDRVCRGWHVAAHRTLFPRREAHTVVESREAFADPQAHVILIIPHEFMDISDNSRHIHSTPVNP